MRILSLAAFFLLQSLMMSSQETVDLAGEWQFKLDPQNKGIEEEWFEKASFPDKIRLPGCLQGQGYGNVPDLDTEWWAGEQLNEWFEERPWLAKYKEAENFKTQQFLVPDRHYLGAAWYATEIDIPPAWQEKRVELFLERCHWETQVWLDGEFVGKDRSLGTPHVYGLKNLRPGKHKLVIRVDNFEIVNLGKKPHSVSEQTAGTWNGMVGKLQLRAGPPVFLQDVQLYPVLEQQNVQVKGKIVTLDSGRKGNYKLVVTVSGMAANEHAPENLQMEGEIKADTTSFAFDFPMGKDVQLWDEFDPNLYEMTLSLQVDSDKGIVESKGSYRFGMRRFATDGRTFTMNGTRTFLRGNVDCAVFPKTGYAPMDVASWRKVWQTYKDFGLNMARFHSWCPPEAAFIAADEMGIYLAPEVGEWVWVGKEDQYDFMQKESSKILQEYGNHPSFIQFGLGNEASANKEFARKLIQDWKAKDPRHLYTLKANSKGNPPNVDFEVVREAGKPPHRIRYQSGWPPEPMNSEFQSESPSTQRNWEDGVLSREIPIIQHETAQITGYPDIEKEIPKYNGYLNPSYLEIAQEQLRERGMQDQLPDFVEASGKWQVALTKEEFEAGYRTKGLAGFHWLCLADFTGQNTAPVGFTDAFYDTKSYVDPDEVRQWNAPTVLLASLEKRVYTSLEDFKATLMVSHFGKEDMELAVQARLKNTNGKVMETWELPKKQVTQGNAQPIGEISGIDLKVNGPSHFILALLEADKQLRNQWDIWVFPEFEKKNIPESIVVADTWSPAIANSLQQGKTVLLLPKQQDLKGKLPICFTNYYWTSFGANEGQSSAAGMLIDTEHPIFKDFPTEKHTDWHWWDVLTYAHPMILDSYDSKNPWPKSYKASIQPIDTWKINRKLGLLVEAKVGNGKLMICSIDLETAIDDRPVTKQLRHNLLEYMQSKSFNPKNEIRPEAIKEVFDTEKSRIDE